LQKTAAAGGANDRRRHSKCSPATLVVVAEDSTRWCPLEAIDDVREVFGVANQSIPDHITE
jgi:hypothetical protein